MLKHARIMWWREIVHLFLVDIYAKLMRVVHQSGTPRAWTNSKTKKIAISKMKFFQFFGTRAIEIWNFQNLLHSQFFIICDNLQTRFWYRQKKKVVKSLKCEFFWNPHKILSILSYGDFSWIWAILEILAVLYFTDRNYP